MVATVIEPVPNRLRSVREVAAYLGQSEQSVYRRIRTKQLQASKVGGEWRISDEAICKLIEDGMNVKTYNNRGNEENI
jgi:excisionase family DNA binding protein